MKHSNSCNYNEEEDIIATSYRPPASFFLNRRFKVKTPKYLRRPYLDQKHVVVF